MVVKQGSMGARRGYGWLVVWPLVSLLLLGALGLAASVRIEQEHHRIETQALHEASAAAQAYEQFVTRSIAHMDQVSMQLKQSWEQSGGTLRLGEMVREGMFVDSAFACVAILDRRGAMRTAIHPDACGSLLAQAGFFNYHQNSNDSALHIGPPPGAPTSAHAAMLFSRRLDTAEGDFDGAVLLIVHANYLNAFYLPSTLGPHSLVATAGAASGLRIEQAVSDGRLASTTRFPFDAGLWDDIGGARVVNGRHGFPDGSEHLLGWRRSAVYPVVALVSAQASEAMAPWNVARRGIVEAAVLAAAAVLLGGGALTVIAWRSARRRRAHDQISSAYRTATEGANEGFFMAMPVRDADGRLVDFELVDCNERGARFHNLARAELIGRRLSALDAGTPGAKLFDAYLLAMEAGVFEDERPMPAGARHQGGWARRRIVRVGDGLAITLQDVSERRAHQAELQRVTNEDQLTGLPNRQWLLRYLPGCLAQTERDGRDAALLLVNLDDFKFINETHGPAAGDLVLQAASTRLQSLVRLGDRVVRFGGDEFMLIVQSAPGDPRIERVAARIVDAFIAPIPLVGGSLAVGASVGVSMFSRDGREVADLIKHAAIALDVAKSEGKGRFRFYDEALSRALQTRVHMRQSLVEAIENDQFVLHYQPRVDTHTGALCSMEALVRWVHPQRGMIPPLEFIALAEASGLIDRIGEMVMIKACRQLAQWRSAGLPLVPVSINVSPKQFSGGEVPAQLADALRACAIPADLLEVEITESAMMDEHGNIAAQLDAIRALGIKLHLDDFGTGYSSLSQLQRLKMDVLKVDRAFTSELTVTSEGRVFFQAIVSMAHALGMAVVAEGVENAAQLDILRELDCNEVQGYYIARPLQPEAMADAMRQRFLLPVPVTV